MCASAYFFMPVRELSLTVLCTSRKEGQDTQDELQKRNLRDELEDRERRHFSSKDKSYIGKKGKREKKNIFQLFVIPQLLIVNVLNLPHSRIASGMYLLAFCLSIELNCMLL